MSDPYYLAVIEWDTSTHGYAYDLWLKAVKADGGEKFAALCDIVGEPLIEGMIVGTTSDKLSQSQAEQVLLSIRGVCQY